MADSDLKPRRGPNGKPLRCPNGKPALDCCGGCCREIPQSATLEVNGGDQASGNSVTLDIQTNQFSGADLKQCGGKASYYYYEHTTEEGFTLAAVNVQCSGGNPCDKMKITGIALRYQWGNVQDGFEWVATTPTAAGPEEWPEATITDKDCLSLEFSGSLQLLKNDVELVDSTITVRLG